MTTWPFSSSGKAAMEVAAGALREGGGILMSYFHGEKKVQSKGRGNIVTDVDVQAEKALVSILQREYPDSSILCEESQAITGDSGYTWIVDPLDGTNNYAWGIPFFAAALALTKGSEVLLGMVYDPVRDELFWARKGGGAFLNNLPIFVSAKRTVQDSLIGFDMGYDDEKAREALKLVTAIWPGMHSIRVMGSAALGLSYAACGRLDLYFHHNLFPWDVASGILLVNEAGGKITDREGGPISIGSTGAIASNEAIHGEFVRLIRET